MTIPWRHYLAPLALAGLFAAAAAASVPVAMREGRSAAAEADLAESLGAPPPLPWDSSDDEDACGPSCPPRVAAAQGLGLATDALLAAHMMDRVTKAEQAEALLTRAIHGRPSAGEWWGWLAFARVGAGEEPADVVQALGESYRLSPFLPHLAAWRISQCARLWPQLPPGVRRAAADEIAWFKSVEPEDGTADALVRTVRDPQAHAALAAALARPAQALASHRISRVPGDVLFAR